MKLKLLPFILALFFALRPSSRAQDDEGGSPIKVTITKYADHSYSAMKTDPDAHSAENSKYDPSGKLLQTTVFDLDAQGKALGGAVYSPKKTEDGGVDPKGVLLYKMRYKYDEMGRVGEVDNYTPSDQLLSRQIYHYDASGRSAKIDTFDASGKAINGSSVARPR